MAIIIITVQDTAEGSVDVRMVTDPVVTPGQTEFTTAQRMGAVALNAITGALEEESPIIMQGGNSKIYIPN
ncbi:hypothetical protein [Pseudomonas sp.]|uniref:hypothetical protein n=1 Tax=Pseudomonas sp. TaxID=306 RepID=UPI002588E4F6|nr:hypothetical protein [Pseudomonas sp.]